MNENELRNRLDEENAVACFKNKDFKETLRTFRSLYNLVNDPEFDFSRMVAENILEILRDESVDERARYFFLYKVYGCFYYFKCKEGLWCDVPKEVLDVKKPLSLKISELINSWIWYSSDKDIKFMQQKERNWQNRRGCIVNYDESVPLFYDKCEAKFPLFTVKQMHVGWNLVDHDELLDMLVSDDVGKKECFDYTFEVFKMEEEKKQEEKRKQYVMDMLQEKGEIPFLFSDLKFKDSMYMAEMIYQILCDKKFEFNETVVDNIGFTFNSFMTPVDCRAREYFYLRVLFSQNDVVVDSSNGVDTWSYIPDNEIPVGQHEPFEGCHICKRKWSPSKICRKNQPCKHWRLYKTSRQRSVYGTKISDQYRVVSPEETKHVEKMKDGKFSMMLEPYFRNPKFVMDDGFIDKVKEFFDEKEHDNDK